MVVESPTFELTGAEFELAWRAATPAEYPLVLEIRSHGATMSERSQLLDGARAELTRRQLWTGADPVARVAQAMQTMGSPEVELDIRAQGPDGGTRAFAARSGQAAVLAVCGGEGYRITPISEFSLPAAILSTMSHAEPGTGQLNARTTELRRATTAAGDDPQRLAAGLRKLGVPARDASRMADALLTVAGIAQIGAAARINGERRRAPRVVGLVDTGHGRYVVSEHRCADATSWTTWAPATRHAVHRAVAELLTGATAGPTDGVLH